MTRRKYLDKDRMKALTKAGQIGGLISVASRYRKKADKIRRRNPTEARRLDKLADSYTRKAKALR